MSKGWLTPMTLVLLYAGSGWSTTTSAQDADPLDNKLVFAVVVNRIFNRGNVALVDDFMAKDVTNNGTPLGRAGFKTLVKDLRTMTPDLKLTVEDVVTQGDRVFGLVTQTGGGASERRILLLRIDDGLVQEQWSWPAQPELPTAPEIPSVIPPSALANLPGLEPSASILQASAARQPAERGELSRRALMELPLSLLPHRCAPAWAG